MIRKLLLLIIFVFLINTDVFGQCNNGTSYGSAIAPIDTTPATMSTCNYQTEYATVSNVVIGETYEITNSCGGYITVRSGTSNGPVVGSGNAPFSFTATVAGNHFIHFNTNAACGQATNCCTTVISCTSCSGPTPPANDDPCSAIALGVNATCTFSTYTNANATASTGIPAPTCSSYAGGDVWFTATVPASGNISIDTDTGVITDSGMAIYSATGTCPTLTLSQIACDDDGSANGAMSAITSSGLAPGSTIYIRVWEYGNNNNGTFDICVSEPPAPPSNDDPCGAIGLTVNPDFLCGSTTTGSVASALDSGIDACFGTPDDDV
ncbi:hypothetical protein, partial [Psychroserpens mesophilus]|uniref:hypothetical protein n=1 Tax=Psychroserpens mesophilus TaxID=325473 RepID=UPI003D6544E3